MARFDTGHGNLEDIKGVGRLWNNCSFDFTIVAFPLLAADGVQYGAWGYVDLQRHVCDVRHLKGNGNNRLYIY